MGHQIPANLMHAPLSPLVLSDQLITLAQAADNAGLRDTATRLVDLAYAVFDERRASTVRRVS